MQKKKKNFTPCLPNPTLAKSHLLLGLLTQTVLNSKTDVIFLTAVITHFTPIYFEGNLLTEV